METSPQLSNGTGVFLYNTMARRKEELVPREAGKIALYVCGVTPYDALHIGHARAFMAYDALRRVLEARGLVVTHVQNITDVEDKIIERAKQNNEDPLELAARYAAEALEDTQALNILPAHRYPKVSDSMDEIVEMVRVLEEKGYAYARNGDVYFDVSRDEDYGRLSGQKPDELEAGARVETGEDKDDPLDFALWKGAKNGEPAWPSPYGEGRPGWHIECSAMSLRELGADFDIHGGARELVFPHHENEVAQSDSYLGEGETFARIWWHCGELRVEGRKMSKSLGNFVTVRDGLKLEDKNVWRLLFLMTHPRSPLDFSSNRVKIDGQESKSGEVGRLEQTASAWSRLKNALLPHEAIAYSAEYSGKSEAAKNFLQKFEAALCDDLNTPDALSVAFDAVTEFNRNGDIELARAVRGALEMLGFTFEEKSVGDALTPALLDVLVRLRNEARERRDWKTSDAVRDELAALGIALEDGPEGTRWKLKDGA